MSNHILRFSAVTSRTGQSRSTVYNRINPKHPQFDPAFPKPIQLGPRIVGFLESEIDEWIKTRIKESRGAGYE
ncbi:MAG: AlpA family transcriptional regulator [Gammaproteobacteria bacterium]|nr:AlpA family transcriptional regulator [Gammaproteobacteria bacterium]